MELDDDFQKRERGVNKRQNEYSEYIVGLLMRGEAEPSREGGTRTGRETTEKRREKWGKNGWERNSVKCREGLSLEN